MKFVLHENVMVPMSDGIRLATDIYLPAGKAGPFPVILERTPYGKSAPSDFELESENSSYSPKSDVAEFYTTGGFALVLQDCRGRYDSEGEFEKYYNEASDGLDMLKWISVQPWCNGKIGVMGFSYTSHAAAAMACLAPRELSCLFIDSGGFSSAYKGGIRQGGALELKQLTWLYNQALKSPQAKENPALMRALEAENIKDWFKRMPWKAEHSPLRHFPEYEKIAFEFWRNGTYGEYWKRLGINTSERYDEFADVPMLLMTGWFDPYVRTVLDNFTGLSGKKSSPVYLVIGPWMHTNRGNTRAGDIDFGPSARIRGTIGNSYQDMKKNWFESYLSGARETFSPHERVLVFVMGGGSGRKTADGTLEHGGSWVASSDWPLPGTRFIDYHLHASGRLDPEKPVSESASAEFVYDPAHPVPTIGGTITSGEPVMVGGAFDQREDPRFFGSTPPYLPLASRNDILVYQTPMLDRAVTVAGPIKAKLWISSDCPDTDFTIKLVDVHPANEDYPHGFAMNLTDGILRVRYRDSWERPELMVPGQVYLIEVEAFATANKFEVGHRIRLDISSSNYPHFDLNPNTGYPEGEGQVTVKARNKIFMDAYRPSCVILPVVDFS